MLKLKRVEIQGFKSFYGRTEMKFSGSGIAAIVGPNGCGKSNLSDAISWVLGEQSAKTLRGARMEDVIFSGTRDKKALGMASVTMTLVPDTSLIHAGASSPIIDASAALNLSGSETLEGAPDVSEGRSEDQIEAASVPASPFKSDAARAAGQTGEITITRRLYRSGESEYLINGRTARLRDIQDLFLGTGLGPESYAIIEQGRIGQILSNRPQDRRSVIEEAAGITKFKTRKRLAEAKLESAKQNLARVFDILEEVTRQVNSLKRQAAKAKRYVELKEEATAYLRQILSAKFRMLERETTKLTIELNLVSHELETAQAAIGEDEAEQTGKLEGLYSTEQELTNGRKQLADLHLEAERARGKLEYQVRQVEQMGIRLSAGEAEVAALAEQESERVRELEGQSVAVEALEAEYTIARETLELRAGERLAAQGRLSGQEHSVEASRQRIFKILGESSALKNRITQGETHLASADRDRARLQAEEQQAEGDGTRLQRLREELSDRLALRQTELLSVTDQRQGIEGELQEKRLALGESRQAVDRLRSESSRTKARRDSLEEIIQHRSYTTETVKRLFTAVEKGKARDLQPVGVLADFLEVDPQVEKATEEFLHDELEFVVVRSWAEADRGIELMRNELDGRATFLVEAGENDSIPVETPQPSTETPGIRRLTDALRLTNGLTNLPQAMLPRISGCYLVEDRTAARMLATEYPHCWFLTPDGVNFHGRAVGGGKKTGAGPLALKRELREVSRLEAAKQAELNEAQRLLSALEQTIQSLTEHLESLRARQQTREKDVLALDHESRKLAEEFQRVQARLSRARLELDRMDRERTSQEANLERDRAALTEAERVRAELERALEAEREQLQGLQSELARAGEEHATVRASLASIEERRRSLAADRQRLGNQVGELRNRRAHLFRESDRLVSERAQFQLNNAELEGTSAALQDFIAEAEGKVKVLAERETEFRADLASLEERLKRLRSAARVAQERRSELQVSLARAETDLKHLDETAGGELQTTLRELGEGAETIPEPGQIDGLDAKYAEVRRKIEALGPVNAQAAEEFEEAQQRQEFLQTQRQDLLDSIRDIEKAIGEIDAESRKRFGEAFHAINANFRELFKTLFGGGTGEMRLTDEENLAESGVDIVASPNSKKMQSVLMLSCGEKSLNMAEETQFIVITHSKRTMEAAQSLYGVTMQEPGVSKLVSVKFDATQRGREGQEIAEAREEKLEAVLV